MESEFYNHYVAYAPPLEPYAVLLHVEEDKATVSASTRNGIRHLVYELSEFLCGSQCTGGWEQILRVMGS